MDLTIDVNGRSHAVRVETHEGAFRVTIDGRARLVDAAALDEYTWSLICLSEGRESQDAGLAETGVPGELDVHMASGVASVRVSVDGAGRGARAAAAGAGSGPGGARQVVSPMPGKIVKVLVQPGDQVTARQGVVVVEAMKMENELRAPRDGRVTEVRVAEGVLVEAGRVLVVIE